MLLTMHRSKSNPEIAFQYGGRPFNETASSFISAVDWDISSKFGTRIDFHFLKQISSLNLNAVVHFRLYYRHLEKLIRRHNSAADRIITTKFDRPMQNDMPMTIIHISKSKQEREFQYGGRPFSETGSSYNSAVDWAISSKFGMQIDYVLPKQIPSSNPEVVFRLYGRHLEKSIWRHNSAADRPITTKFGREMQNGMLLTMHRSKSNPEIEFQYGDRPFNETASSFISAVDWDISSTFGTQIDFNSLKQIRFLNLNAEVHFRLYGRHLEKSIWRHNSAAYRPITMKFGRQMHNDMPMSMHRS